MKKFTVLLFVALLAGAFAQISAQQVVASAGGYYEGENISLSWTVGEPVIETFSGTNVILTQGFQQPYSFYLSQILNIPAGWSGVSSYVDPLNKNVEGIFSGYVPDFFLLASMTDLYFPSQGINTIGNWNYQTGYKIKAENTFDVTLTGTKIAIPTVELAAGWNLMPVLSYCGATTDELFATMTELDIIKEVAGVRLYWPAYGIGTLQNLEPGKAYFARMNNSAEFIYPACSKSSPQTLHQNPPMNFNPWNEQHYSAVSHAIAFPSEILMHASFMIGDIIGVFTPEGLCAGTTEITNTGKNAAIVAFADDETIAGKDGFDFGEMFRYKIFRPGTAEEFDLLVEYSTQLPNMGMFADQGLSAVKSLTLQGSSSSEASTIVADIFPNPSDGIFNLSLNYWPETLRIELLDATGQTIKHFEQGKKPDGSSLEFNLTHLPDGVYFLKLIDQKFIETKKIVIH